MLQAKCSTPVCKYNNEVTASMRPVMITMKSRQKTPDNAEETELVTLGNYSREDGVLTLSYEDTDATGFAGSTTSVRVGEDDLVTILRTGTANSNLTLELGKKHFCLYQTPYGSMTLGVQARRILLEEEENGGRVQLEYTTDMNASFLSENEIDMRWEFREEIVPEEPGQSLDE